MVLVVFKIFFFQAVWYKQKRVTKRKLVINSILVRKLKQAINTALGNIRESRNRNLVITLDLRNNNLKRK